MPCKAMALKLSIHPILVNRCHYVARLGPEPRIAPTPESNVHVSPLWDESQCPSRNQPNPRVPPGPCVDVDKGPSFAFWDWNKRYRPVSLRSVLVLDHIFEGRDISTHCHPIIYWWSSSFLSGVTYLQRTRTGGYGYLHPPLGWPSNQFYRRRHQQTSIMLLLA